MFLKSLMSKLGWGKYGLMIRLAKWAGKEQEIPEIMYLLTDGPSKHLNAYCHAILRGPGALDVALREIIFAFGSWRNGCDFCGNSHIEVAQLHNPTLAIRAIITNFDTHPEVAKAKLGESVVELLKFCDKVRSRDGLPTQADIDHLKGPGGGWTEEQISHAIKIVALHSFFNRFVDGHGVASMSPEGYKACAKNIAKSYC